MKTNLQATAFLALILSTGHLSAHEQGDKTCFTNRAGEEVCFTTRTAKEACEAHGETARWLYTCYRFPGQTYEVTSLIPRNVADGAHFAKDNLTSMGFAKSDGAVILRIRSTQDQSVHLRKAGGGSSTIHVGKGDTFVAVKEPGTYIATFSATHRRVTKATGPQEWDDVIVETRERDVPKYRQELLTRHLRD